MDICPLFQRPPDQIIGLHSHPLVWLESGGFAGYCLKHLSQVTLGRHKLKASPLEALRLVLAWVILMSAAIDLVDKLPVNLVRNGVEPLKALLVDFNFHRLSLSNLDFERKRGLISGVWGLDEIALSDGLVQGLLERVRKFLRGWAVAPLALGLLRRHPLLA